MKSYKSRFKEKNSLDILTDTSIPQKLVDFIKKNPFPTDHEGIHKFAEEELKIDPDILEQYCYAFLTLMFKGGVSKGEDVKASKENIDIGHKIEIEHVSYDTDNEVIKEMQNIMISKITNDHLAETDTYYVDGVNFKNELEKENK